MMASFTLLAQNMTLIEGESFKDDNSIWFTAPYGDDYVVLAVEKPQQFDGDLKHQSYLEGTRSSLYIDPNKDIYVSKLNSKLAITKLKKKERRRELLTEINAKKINLYSLENIDGKIYMYYTKYMKKSKNVSHCVMEINVENPSKSVETVLAKEKFKKKKPKTVFLKNKDASVISFVSDPYGKEKDKLNINVSTFSTADHSPLWSQTYATGKMRKQISFDALHLADNGTLFFGYKDYVKDSEKKSIKNKKGEKIPAYIQNVIALSENETQSLEMNLGNDYPNQCDLKSDNERLIVCGTYFERHKGNITGVYSSIIDLATFTATTATKSEFGDALIDQLDDENMGTTKKKDPGITTYNGIGTILNEENGLIKYIYEPFVIDIVRYNTGTFKNPSYSTTTYYVAKSIIVVDINESDVEFTSIPRSVRFPYDFRAIQTKAVETDNQLYLLYLDHKENVQPKKRKKKKKNKLKDRRKSQEGVIAVAKFVDNKTIERTILKDLDDEDFYFNPSFMTKVSPTEYILIGISDGWFSSKKQKNLLLKL